MPRLVIIETLSKYIYLFIYLSSVCPSVCLSIYLSSVCRFTYHLSVCLFTYHLSVFLSVCLSVYLSFVCLSVCLPIIFLSVCLSLPIICLSVCLPIICLSVYASIYLSIYPSFHLFPCWLRGSLKVWMNFNPDKVCKRYKYLRRWWKKEIRKSLDLCIDGCTYVHCRKDCIEKPKYLEFYCSMCS